MTLRINQENPSLEFILKLNSRLSTPIARQVDTNGKPTRKYYTYSDKPMTRNEITMLLEIVEESETYVLCPGKYYPGFPESFLVYDLDSGHDKPLLQFTDSNLPKNYDLTKLSEVYQSESNIKKARAIGIDII